MNLQTLDRIRTIDIIIMYLVFYISVPSVRICCVFMRDVMRIASGLAHGSDFELHAAWWARNKKPCKHSKVYLFGYPPPPPPNQPSPYNCYPVDGDCPVVLLVVTRYFWVFRDTRKGPEGCTGDERQAQISAAWSIIPWSQKGLILRAYSISGLLPECDECPSGVRWVPCQCDIPCYTMM